MLDWLKRVFGAKPDTSLQEGSGAAPAATTVTGPAPPVEPVDWERTVTRLQTTAAESPDDAQVQYQLDDPKEYEDETIVVVGADFRAT